MTRFLFVLCVVGCAREPAAPRSPVEVARDCEHSAEPMQCHAAAVLSTTPADAARAAALIDRGNDAQWRRCHAADATSCRFIVATAKIVAGKTADPDERRLAARVVIGAGTLGCQAGDYDVCLDVAALLFRGEGGEVDRDRARELAKFACDHDHQPACVERALTLYHQPGGEGDPNVVRLLEHACERGEANGCAQLASLRLADPTAGAAARTAAQRACELGDAGGCGLYGHCLLDGIGGASDRAAAVTALATACKGGDDRGCQQLALLGAH